MSAVCNESYSEPPDIVLFGPTVQFNGQKSGIPSDDTCEYGFLQDILLIEETEIGVIHNRNNVCPLPGDLCKDVRYLCTFRSCYGISGWITREIQKNDNLIPLSCLGQEAFSKAFKIKSHTVVKHRVLDKLAAPHYLKYHPVLPYLIGYNYPISAVNP